MTESSINPAIDLPKSKTLLTRQLLQTQRAELYRRLVEREEHWINELTTHASTKNPDRDQLASISSLANAYKSLIPYADLSYQHLSYNDHRNQTITRDTMEKCHSVSKVSDTDFEELEEYRGLALFFHFASKMADQNKPLTHTQEKHDTCVSYWQFYAQRPKPDVRDKEGSFPASMESAAIEREKWEVWKATLQGLEEYAWLQSGKQTEDEPDKWGLRK